MRLVHVITFSTPYLSASQPAIFQPNFQETYWGNHYPRLRAFKEALDPKDLLIVRQGVNSEGWDDEILCKTV